MAVSASTRTLGRSVLRRGALNAAFQQQCRCTANSNLKVAEVDSEFAAARPFHEMPGPNPLPLIGNIWRFLPGIGEWANMDFLDIHRKIHAQYGDIVRITGLKKDMVFIYNPEDVEKVYRTEGSWPFRDSFQSLRHYRHVMHKDKFEGAFGLLTTQNEEWQSFRRRVSPPLLQPRSVALYTSPIDQVAGDFVERLRELRNPQGFLPDDSMNWFCKWALESIATVALDKRLGCLDMNLSMDSESQKMIDAVNDMFDGTFEMDIKPRPWTTRRSSTWKNFVKAVDLFVEVSNKYISEAMARIKKKAEEGGKNQFTELSILERLLLNSDDPRVAITMAVDMLFAGIDSTSFATAAHLYLISKNPEKQEMVFEELRRVLPTPDTPVTSEILSQLKYLKASIKESMRLKPVAIGQLRENTRDDLVLSNYQIPKGVDLIMGMRIIADEEKYFPDPQKFLPERWVKGNVQSNKVSAFTFLPFGFGPRMCVGKRIAELEIEVLNAKLLRNFRVEYPHGEAKFETKLVHMMTSPMNFRLTERN